MEGVLTRASFFASKTPLFVRIYIKEVTIMKLKRLEYILIAPDKRSGLRCDYCEKPYAKYEIKKGEHKGVYCNKCITY